MDISLILADLEGYYGGQFTASQVKKHLKKINLDGVTIDQVIAAAKEKGLLAE